MVTINEINSGYCGDTENCNKISQNTRMSEISNWPQKAPKKKKYQNEKDEFINSVVTNSGCHGDMETTDETEDNAEILKNSNQTRKASAKKKCDEDNNFLNSKHEVGTCHLKTGNRLENSSHFISADTITDSDHLDSIKAKNLDDQVSSKKYSLRKSQKRDSNSKHKEKNKTENMNKVESLKKPHLDASETVKKSDSGKKNDKPKKRKRSKITNNNNSSDITEDSESKKFQCHICGNLLKSSSALVVHQRIHTGEKPFSCTVCNKNFSIKESLNRHLRTHTGEKPYVCNFCGESYSQAASLKRHTGRHTGNYPFKCDVCDKHYVQHYELVLHLQSHAGTKRQKQCVCEVCGTMFVSTRNLVRHVSWIHKAEKPFVCDVCGKGFLEINKLTTHQRYHTGERPFRCVTCDRGFVDKGNLREHIKIHDENERKNFQCNLCNRKLSSSKSLCRHVRTIHTKEDVYTCDICWKHFGQTGNLKIHRQRHHKDAVDENGVMKSGANVSASSFDDDNNDDVCETYICEKDKVYVDKSSQVDSSWLENGIKK